MLVDQEKLSLNKVYEASGSHQKIEDKGSMKKRKRRSLEECLEGKTKSLKKAQKGGRFEWFLPENYTINNFLSYHGHFWWFESIKIVLKLHNSRLLWRNIWKMTRVPTKLIFLSHPDQATQQGNLQQHQKNMKEWNFLVTSVSIRQDGKVF